MISEIVVGEDEAHFPIVSWTESRGHRAAGGPGVVEVECRIMKDADGVLLFAVRGAKRRGLFLDARPWETLQGFSIRGARDLYETPNERALEELRYFTSSMTLLGVYPADPLRHTQ